mmetsp:Transcript_28836/g.44828  ORF Transcript_28836/g.44828 Transcript_28836/m.44828 type:complete len:83 (+) Transcript_28836:1653-1901(+)
MKVCVLGTFRNAAMQLFFPILSTVLGHVKPDTTEIAHRSATAFGLMDAETILYRGNGKIRNLGDVATLLLSLDVQETLIIPR